MAKDDMMLIVYKVLRYLYGCNKEGKITTFEDMFNASSLSGMPQSYVAQILKEMVDNGFISGCNFTETKSGTVIMLSDNATVTMRGVEYLDDNSKMRKAAEVTGKAFEIMLSGIISAAVSKA